MLSIYNATGWCWQHEQPHAYVLQAPRKRRKDAKDTSPDTPGPSPEARTRPRTWPQTRPQTREDVVTFIADSNDPGSTKGVRRPPAARAEPGAGAGQPMPHSRPPAPPAPAPPPSPPRSRRPSRPRRRSAPTDVVPQRERNGRRRMPGDEPGQGSPPRASQNPTMTTRLPHFRFVQRSVARFMPGESAEEALGGGPTAVPRRGRTRDVHAPGREHDRPRPGRGGGRRLPASPGPDRGSRPRRRDLGEAHAARLRPGSGDHGDPRRASRRSFRRARPHLLDRHRIDPYVDGTLTSTRRRSSARRTSGCACRRTCAVPTTTSGACCPPVPRSGS